MKEHKEFNKKCGGPPSGCRDTRGNPTEPTLLDVRTSRSAPCCKGARCDGDTKRDWHHGFLEPHLGQPNGARTNLLFPRLRAQTPQPNGPHTDLHHPPLMNTSTSRTIEWLHHASVLSRFGPHVTGMWSVWAIGAQTHFGSCQLGSTWITPWGFSHV